jgi:prolyl oligopeptidase
MVRSFDSRIRRRLTSLLSAGILFLTLHAVAQTPRSIAAPPVAPVRPVTDTYFGQQVIDPYRYLEDQKSPEVVAFMRGQADYTRAVLDSIPGRQAFAAEMSRYMNAEEAAITDVKVAGPYLFYRKRKRDENQASLYVRTASGGPERMLLDLPKLSTATSHVSLDDYTPSDDGKFASLPIYPRADPKRKPLIFTSRPPDATCPKPSNAAKAQSFPPKIKAFSTFKGRSLPPTLRLPTSTAS